MSAEHSGGIIEEKWYSYLGQRVDNVTVIQCCSFTSTKGNIS